MKTIGRGVESGHLCGCLGGGQLGPDSLPGLLADHLASDGAIRFSLHPARLGWPHIAPSGQALIQVLLVDGQLFGQSPPLGGGELFAHARKSSVTLT